METGIIYKATSPSGKVYIGQTINRLDHRVWQHRTKARSGHMGYFQEAIRKYENDVIFEILEEVPKEYLDERELYWIKYFKSDESAYGYNDPTYERQFIGYIPETTLQQIFKLFYEEKLTIKKIEKILKISDAYIGNILSGKARPHIKKWYEDLVGHPVTYISTRYIEPEIIEELLELYHLKKESVTCIKEKYPNLSFDTVQNIVSGSSHKNAYNEFFKKRGIEPSLDRRKYSDDILYSCFSMRYKQNMYIKDISKKMGIDYSFLSIFFNGQSRSDIKERWEKENGPVPVLSEIRSKIQKDRMNNTNLKDRYNKKIICSDGRTFSSRKEAAKVFGVSDTYIGKVIKNKTEWKGITFFYADDKDNN